MFGAGVLLLLPLAYSDAADADPRKAIWELKKDNFDGVLADNKDVLVHFYAPCAPDIFGVLRPREMRAPRSKGARAA